MYSIDESDKVNTAAFNILLADIHTCRSHPCLNGGTCRDGINAYLCSCTDDFTGSVCEQCELFYRSIFDVDLEIYQNVSNCSY